MNLSILDKFKLAVWLNGLTKEGGAVDKIKAVFAKLDGLKTVIGLVVVVAYYVVPQFVNVSIPDVVLKIGEGLVGVGLAAKMEKGVGILTKVIEYTKKGLDIAQKVVDAVAPKAEGK